MTSAILARGFGFLFWLANRDARAKEFMADWAICGPRTVQFNIAGEKPFYVRITNGRAILSDGRAESPDVVLRGKVELFSKMLAGDIDPDEAYSRQRYDIVGSIDDAIRFRYVAELTQNRHSFLVGLLRNVLKVFS